jgi:hypothetical protein
MGTCPTSNLTSIMVVGTACSTLTTSSQLFIHRRRSNLPQLSGGQDSEADYGGLEEI